jgi:prophage regulatory protein
MPLIGYDEIHSKGIPYSETVIRRKSAAGEFPQPIRFSKRRFAWDEAEVDAWLEDRRAARPVAAQASEAG